MTPTPNAVQHMPSCVPGKRQSTIGDVKNALFMSVVAFVALDRPKNTAYAFSPRKPRDAQASTTEPSL